MDDHISGNFKAHVAPVPKAVRKSMAVIKRATASQMLAKVSAQIHHHKHHHGHEDNEHHEHSHHDHLHESSNHDHHHEQSHPDLHDHSGHIHVENRTQTIPGNAKASMMVPSHSQAHAVESENAGVQTMHGESVSHSALRLQAISPSMFQMENLKQQQSLNRLASVRHSMAVHSGVSHAKVHSAKLSEEHANLRNANTSIINWATEAASANNKIKNSFMASRRRFTVKRANELEGDADVQAAKQRQFEEEWDTVTSVRANDLHTVTKYRSKNTGLEVVHAQLVSPTVHGYFVIGTKCQDDMGLPHILEHMVFLGSHTFPFPHVLDKLGSKCLASGTNAWSDSDHSCYTLTTAGKEGFLTLLPVYLDHIFFPTLGEAGYLTEIHHINKDGKDGGVVYLEMQSIEHDALEQANWALLREIYPPESGYFYNYGGYCTDMRDHCTLQSVKNFHKKYYHPRNACLVICGDLEKDEILDVINPFLDTLLDTNIMPETWEKPWINEPPIQIPEDIGALIYFPSEHEGRVLVKIGIVGPTVTEDTTKAVGFRLLMQYLLDSPVAPIQRDFVEHENAISSHVHLTEVNNTQVIFCINFENIPEPEMKQVPIMLRNLLEKQINNEFDQDRMESIVSHCYQQELSAMENSAEKKIAHAVIADFLYESKDDGLMFDRRINNAYTIEQFSEQPNEFWIKLIQSLLDCKWATVYAVPSKLAHEEFHLSENERGEFLRGKFGENGRNKLNARLKAAVKIQARPPPPELINAFTTPPISSIGFLGIIRNNNPYFASETLCNLYLDDINSSYVYLTVLMDTTELSLEEKKYLVLFAGAILESPYVDSAGTFFTHEQTIDGLNRDVLKYETFFGADWDGKEGTRFSCGSYSHLFCIRFQLEMKKVKEGFEWMQILLWNTKWEAGRLKIAAQRMANEVNNLVNHGTIMAHAMLADSLYQMGSNVKAMSLIRQQLFLQRIADELPKSFKKVAKMLEAIRMCILRPENTTVHVATCLPKMDFYLTDKPEVRDATAQLLQRTFDYTGWNWGYNTKRLANDPDFKTMKGIPCIQKCTVERILRMHSDEGSYLVQASPCIKSYNDPEYPLVLTAIQYFCQVDGPFYRAIKATGFATGVYMKVKPNEGMIYFELKPCLDLVGAYCAAFDIIVSHLEEYEKGGKDVIWNDTLLQTAKSSQIFELIEQENTPRCLAINSLLDYYHGVPQDFRRTVIERITLVTMEEVKKITKKYFRALFVEITSCACAAPNDKVPEIIKGLMDHCGKRLSLLPPVHLSEMAAFHS